MNNESKEVVKVHETHLVPGGEFYAARGKETVVGWYNKKFVFRLVSISYTDGGTGGEPWAVCTVWITDPDDTHTNDIITLTEHDRSELFTMLGGSLT